MNYCRTCKYWSCNGNMIGLGLCLNTDAMFRVRISDGCLYTAQNFGCVMHKDGVCEAAMFSGEQRVEILNDFIKSKQNVL